MKLIAISVLAVFLSSCSAPTPEVDLAAAVASLDIISALPNLTLADRNWIAAAATGLSCSSTVLAQAEPEALESVAIASCFASLPAVPAGDQPYIQAGIATVQVFITLFKPVPTPAAISANAKVAKMSVAERTAYVDTIDVRSRTQTIRGRVSE
jgi:hypothetical protein